MHWQADGKYLCVKVDRHSKTKKTTFVNFELFRIHEKDIPIELLEIKDTVVAFAWEPHGSRFAIIHGENAARPDISFYTMGDNKLKHLKTLEKKPANHLFWSPKGKFIVLAGLRNLNGVLEFFNVSEMESMGTEEHLMCTAVDWDPSGRYVATTVSYWRHQLDTGYNIYLFTGKPVYKVLKDRFFQLLWRPRPKTLLTEEQIKSIKKNISEYQRVYEGEDKVQQDLIEAARRKERNEMRQEIYSLIAEREREYQSMLGDFNRAIGRESTAEDMDVEEITETIEELLDIVEEVLED